MKQPVAVDWTGKKKVNLALQGGGAHGAFTWGVLDHLLEDGRLDIEAITGASAGAMNAVVFCEGYLEDGRAGARRRLEEFWRSVSSESALSPMQRQAFDTFFKGWNMQSTPAYWWMDLMTHYASPYEFNPLNINPLRDHLARMVDFDKVRACKDIQLFVAATNVQTGKISVFERQHLTADHIMASACLPFLFQAVEIDGAPHWDGGYMGNPALFPLFYKSACPDIVIVQVNPIQRAGAPRSAREIQDRVNEISFNGALLGELRSIDFVNRLVDEGKLSRDRYMRPIMHRIGGGQPLADFGASSKLDTSWPFLTKLRDIGRSAAKAWLDASYDQIGVESTLDTRMAFS